jgi:hypothetical protein
MGISLSSCVSGTRFFQQVVMSAGLYGDCLITVGDEKWVMKTLPIMKDLKPLEGQEA